MFSDIRSWVQHMQYAHARQWCYSSPGHPRQIFETKADYESHMRAVHPSAASDKHLQLLEKRAQVPGVAITKCPFCAYQPKEELKPGEQSHQLVGHVASHLRSIALISLPEDGNDHEEAASASDKANESSEGHAHLVRDDLSALPDYSDKVDESSEGPARGSRDEMSSMSSFSGDVDEVREKFTEALELERSSVSAPRSGDMDMSEWGFMETVFEYAGHDRDPVLQGFLRKLYLESSQTVKSTGGPKLPFASIPFARNLRFFGRSYALGKIDEALLTSPTASAIKLSEVATNLRTFVVYGPGGMGKTQVAAEFVHSHHDDFDAILWAHADDAAKLSQDFNTIACQMGLVAEDSADARDFSHTRELVKRWLVDPRKDVNDPESDRASWLLVFDAVEDSSMLNAFWPYDGPGSILITSRSTFGWSNSLQLVPFSVEEASRYLLDVTERDEAQENHSEIVNVSRKLGGLPLALTQMAGIMTKSDMSFADFARAYNERELRHQLLETAPSPELQAPQYEHSVASVFALENIRHGAALLNACSMLDPDGISERIFTETLAKVHLPGLPSTLSEYHQAKNELLGSSILTTEKGSGKLFVHRLVQDVARTRLSPAALRETFTACVQLITTLWPFIDFTWRHGIVRWTICEELAPHVVRLRELAEQYQLFPSDVDDTGDFAFARLLVDAGWYHHERGSSTDAESFNDMAHQICSTWLFREEERHHPGRGEWWTRKLNTILSELTHNRGCIVVETNKPEVALKYFQEFHRAMEEEFRKSPDLVKQDMRLAIAWNELGNAHMLNRRWDEGKKCFKNSIKTMELLVTFEPTSISLPLVNLGLAYWLQGRPKEALTKLEQGLKDRENAYGMDDRISFFRGRYLQALGNVVGTLGDQEKALDYHRKALLHYKTTLGNGHHRTADMLVKIAEHSIRMGQHENALALLDVALKAYHSRYKGDRGTAYTPEKARALYFRSRALYAMSKDVDADEAFEEAVELLREADSTLANCDPTSLTTKDFDRLVAFWSK
ncbi:hypothetical protein LTR78_006896 [Recurvomyces mirabilis]|uniref:DUF7779 domain-containing protein n=1 Tax=Recurvomyces mirabilis TaxID=574656 RepID=A0AAE0WKF1_9PEZI|nr:hypothetical protein LTR78_006896 [Recurvomyces mirabilis]KAK5153113.1 hypothetical protein LTS14_007757 [Recurvomyces mirabilis]